MAIQDIAAGSRSNSDKIILVTGATGRQGGAVAEHLLAAGIDSGAGIHR